MAKAARIRYTADGDYVDKQAKEFTLTSEVIEKLDSIEPSAEKNAIQGIKVNGELQTPDRYRVVSLAIPEVEDNLDSISSTNALSAKQGRALYNRIKNLEGLGKFLSNWDATTGMPTTNPTALPYDYHSGDYYIVGRVGATNYRPDGTQYKGIPSTTVESEEVKVGDFYFYNGSTWELLLNTDRQIPIDETLSSSSTNPVENRVVTAAINLKANDADISVVGKSNDYNDLDNLPTIPDSLDDLTGTSDDITEGQTNLFLTTAERTKLVNTTGTNTGDETQASIMTKLGNASANSNGYLTAADWNTFNDKQAAISDLATIRSNAEAGKAASDEIATYGDIVTHNSSEYASSSVVADVEQLQSDMTTVQGDITSLQGDMSQAQTDISTNAGNITSLTTRVTTAEGNITTLQGDVSTLQGDISTIQGEISDIGDDKQDTLIAGNNIQIAADGKTISATDTTYTAGPGISISANNVISANDNKATWGSIEGTLSSQTDLQDALDDKQNNLTAGNNIQIVNDTISATDTTYTAGNGISIDANNVISNTQTSAEWGNIQGNIEDQTDLNVILSDKQPVLTAGANIQIASDGRTISATDTTYSANDFDIKDLADTNGLRTIWSAKQNALTAGSNIEITNGTISATDTTYVASDFDIKDLSDSTSLRTKWTGKQDKLTTGTGISINSSNVISNTLPGPTVSDTAPAGSEGALWYDTTEDVLKAYDGTDWKMTGTEMVILKYGSSTWADFIDAYNKNAIVYARASSNSNPASGSQTRLAFMAYVNNETNPTEVEFQYYRSRSDHNSAANEVDEVYIYKLTSASGGTWTVAVRNTAAKTVAGTGIGVSFGSGNMTVSNTGVTSFNGDTGDITLTPGTYLTLSDNTLDVDTSLIATKADLANFAGFKTVTTLPTTDIKTNIIYLLGPLGTGADKYEEYIYSNNAWIKIGETTMDLSSYFNMNTNTSDDITEGSTNLFLTSAERTKLVNTTGVNTGDETKQTIQTKLGAASASNNGYLTSTAYSTFAGKQDAISDLATIRSNASAGAGAATTIATYGDVVTHDADEFATASQGAKADTALQSGDNVSALTNDAGYITASAIPTLDTAMSDSSTKGVQNKVIKAYVDTQVSEATSGAVSDTAYAASWNGVTGIAPSKNAVYDKISAMDTTISGKQDAISDLATIRSNATAGKNASDTIGTYGDIVSHNASEFLTTSKISNTAYGSTWNGVTDTAPSKDAVYDKLNSMDSTIAGKQATISDLSTIRSGASLGATAVQPGDLGAVATTNDYNDLDNLPTIPSVGNGTITIQKNATTVDTFTTNQSTSKTINITVPTTAADVSALPSTTKYGASISMSVDTTNYKITTTLKDQSGNTLGTAQVIDLPMESVVVNGSYDSTTKKIILTLQSGSTIEFSVADLISGLQAEITSTNKLSADLIADGTTNKVVTASEKSTWNGKQDALTPGSNITISGNTISAIDTTYESKAAASGGTAVSLVTTGEKYTWNNKQSAISDLATIRSNATAGAGAATTIAGYGDIVSHNASEFATAAQGAKADTAIQSGDLATVATTGSYTDLSNKPTIPTVNNGTLTITQNGTSKGTFTANQSGASTIELTDTTYSRGTATSGGTALSLVNTGDMYTWNNKQDALVSGTNIKTVNSTSLLGSGNIAVQATLSNIAASDIKTGTATTQRSVTAAALAGGLARISNTANNTTSSGLKIWTGTQANYDALGTYDSSTLYFTTDS